MRARTKIEDLDPEHILTTLRSTVRRLPDQDTTRRLQESSRENAELALDVRGDPFSRDDILVFRTSEKIFLRVPCRDLPVVVGRYAEESDCVLDVKGVSGRHFLLERQGAFIKICDMGSTNGTFVNASRIDATYLREGDVVTVGLTDLKLERA